ncbi:MAG: caspase family protein [Bacteroidota bacterium]|nr:caspase family protein [Bacteroidota bacterium]
MKQKAFFLLTLIFIVAGNLLAQQDRGFIEVRQNAEDHVALVIGNSNYPDMPLINPENDANAVARAFEDMGFIVEKVLDADKEQMAMAIKRFTNKLQTARVAVFYYAGHGMQVDGQNYLIPIGKTASTI